MWALVVANAVDRIFRQPSAFSHEDKQYPAQWFLITDSATQLAAGIRPLAVDAVPEGHYVVSTSYEVQPTIVYEHHVTAPVPPPQEEALFNYAANKARQVMDGGITVLAQTVATDQQARAQLVANSAYLGLPGPAMPLHVWLRDGGVVSLNNSDANTVAKAVLEHALATLATLATVRSAILAATITTFAQIEAAGWPPTAP